MTDLATLSYDDLRHAVHSKITEARHRFEWCRTDTNIVLMSLGLPRIGHEWVEKVVSDEDAAKADLVCSVRVEADRIVSRKTSKISDPKGAMNTLLAELGLDAL